MRRISHEYDICRESGIMEDPRCYRSAVTQAFSSDSISATCALNASTVDLLERGEGIQPSWTPSTSNGRQDRRSRDNYF